MNHNSFAPILLTLHSLFLEMSVVINYKGQRKNFKIASPNILMQDVFLEAVQFFSVSSETHTLKHKRTFIDKSQPFRFCNLSNNAELELVHTSTTGSSSKRVSDGTVCRIAISVEGYGTLTDTFEPSSTLKEVLLKFIADTKLSKNILAASPKIIYLRTEYVGLEALEQTTLLSMGLAG